MPEGVSFSRWQAHSPNRNSSSGDRNGDIDPKTGYKTTSDILAKVRDEFGQGMAVEIASQEIDEIEGGLWLC